MDINSLPEEVLCMIFDHLNLADVKNASLTCKWWKQVIFSGPYLNRFLFKMDLRHRLLPFDEDIVAQVPVDLKPSGGMAREYRLRNKYRGNRCYRHVALTATDLPRRHFDWVMRTIDPDYISRLATLHLVYREQLESGLLPCLSKTLSQLEALEHFTLLLVCEANRLSKNIVLRSNTVRKLAIKHFNCQHSIRVDMPKLRSYTGMLHLLDEGTMLDNLTELTLTKLGTYVLTNNFGYYQERLPRLGKLVKLRIEFALDEDIFRQICRWCRSLQTLTLADQLVLRDVNTFTMITQLRKLRHLELATLSAPNTGTLDLTPLTEMNCLVLNGTFFGDRTRVIFPATIKKVQLHIHCWTLWNRALSMYRICAEIKQLIELDVKFYQNDDDMAVPGLLIALRFIPWLRHLQITKGCIDGPCFGMLDSQVLGLHTIRLVNTRIETLEFSGIPLKFPNVYELRTKGCIDRRGRPIPDTCFRF